MGRERERTCYVKICFDFLEFKGCLIPSMLHVGHSSHCTQICRTDGEGRIPPGGHQHHPVEGGPGGTDTCGQPGC